MSPMTVTVWRVEHDCPDCHGPLQNCNHMSRWDVTTVNYGICLETPNADPLLKDFYLKDPRSNQCIYGTLAEQFPRWWSGFMEEGRDQFLPRGWSAVCFEVADHACWIGVNQVTFMRTYAQEIKRTNTDYPRGPRTAVSIDLY